MKAVYRILFVLHLFTGAGGMFGGLAAILNPQNPLGMPAESLKNSPFENFLIPGIILLTVIGLGNLFCAAAILLNLRIQGYAGSITGWGLVIWITVQCIILGTIHLLHIVFFIIGICQALLSAAILFEKNQFPAGIVVKIYRKLCYNGRKTFK
jgi:hypothetical protein